MKFLEAICELMQRKGASRLSPIDFYYRVGTFCLAYRAGDYIVLEAHENYPKQDGQERNFSIYSINKLFGYGTYEWTAREERNGNGDRQTFLGGFERHHGRPTHGIIMFWSNETGTHIFETSDGKSSKQTTLPPQDWTVNHTFKVQWTANYVKGYVDNSLVATHTTEIPVNMQMAFFTEVFHSWTNAPNGSTKVYFGWKKFRRI